MFVTGIKFPNMDMILIFKVPPIIAGNNDILLLVAFEHLIPDKTATKHAIIMAMPPNIHAPRLLCSCACM